MTATALTALLAACLLWWFSTGALLVAVRLTERGGRRAGIRVTLASLPLLGFGFWALWISLGHVTVQGAYAGFAAALMIWAWFELSFLSGAVTGPAAAECPPGLSVPQRFRRAWRSVSHHEIALALLVLIVFEMSRGAANMAGPWTLFILYFARISAKLNLFLGVAHANTEFLPRHLTHLYSHFGKARLNWLFPVSITVFTFALAVWIERLFSSAEPGAAAGFALLAALTALALLEHWFLVLPWRDAKLWRWMLPKTHADGPHHLFGVD